MDEWCVTQLLVHSGCERCAIHLQTWFYITTLPDKKVREFTWLTSSCDGVCLTQQNGSQYVIGCSYVATFLPSFLHFGRLHVRLFVSHDLRTEKRRKYKAGKKKCGDGKEQDLLQVYVPHPRHKKKKRGERDSWLHEASDFSLVAWKFYS